MARTALVTGASSGIGLAVARSLHERGYRVIGTSRKPEAIPDELRLDGVQYLALDLTDEASIAECARQAGPVDVLVNNAGESQSGPIEELPMDALLRLFQLNVFGAVRLLQLLTPGMRERGYGRVVMIGSMLASFPLPYRSSYVATKAAIKGFSDSARGELSPFGVWVTTIEPGSINTGLSERRTKYIGATSAFAGEFHTMIAKLDAREATGISAERVAATVLTAIEADRPKPLYAVGSRAPVVFALQRLLPRQTLHQFVARQFGVRR
jgi:short-subunit dehydrogenase